MKEDDSDKIHFLLKWIVKARMRIGRGRMWLVDIASLITTAASIKILIPHLPGYTYYLLVLGFVMFFFSVGYLEERKIKTWLYENVYNTRDLNPTFVDMLKRLENIENKLGEKNET